MVNRLSFRYNAEIKWRERWKCCNSTKRVRQRPMEFVAFMALPKKKGEANGQNEAIDFFDFRLCVLGLGVCRNCPSRFTHSAVFPGYGVFLCKIFSKIAQLVYRHQDVPETPGFFCKKEGNDGADQAWHHYSCHSAYGIWIFYDDACRNLGSQHFVGDGLGLPYLLFCVSGENTAVPKETKNCGRKQNSKINRLSSFDAVSSENRKQGGKGFSIHLPVVLISTEKAVADNLQRPSFILGVF